MNTLPIDLYKVIEYGLGGDTWQEFIDRYKEKYDLLQIDGFEFEATKLDYTFSQLITSLGVKTLPAYVDPESPVMKLHWENSKEGRVISRLKRSSTV